MAKLRRFPRTRSWYCFSERLMDPSYARIYRKHGTDVSIEHFKTNPEGHRAWIALKTGTLVAFRGVFDTRPVLDTDYVTKT